MVTKTSVLHIVMYLYIKFNFLVFYIEFPSSLSPSSPREKKEEIICIVQKSMSNQTSMPTRFLTSQNCPPPFPRPMAYVNNITYTSPKTTPPNQTKGKGEKTVKLKSSPARSSPSSSTLHFVKEHVDVLLHAEHFDGFALFDLVVTDAPPPITIMRFATSSPCFAGAEPRRRAVDGGGKFRR